MSNDRRGSRSRASNKSKRSRKTAPRFVLSARKSLGIEKTLLGTLALDRDLIGRAAPNTSELNRFLSAAESAWLAVRTAVDAGQENFVLWLRQLLSEAHSIGLWVPSGFLLRLRQLERGDLSIAGEAHGLPAYAGLPAEFAECSRFLGLDLFYIVPSLTSGKFEDCRARGNDATATVATVTDVWRALPVGVDAVAARRFLVNYLRNRGLELFEGPKVTRAND